MSYRIRGRLLPSLIGAVGVVLWATETTLINLVRHIPPLETVALAFGFAALLMPFMWLLTRQNPFEAFKLPKRVWLLMVSSLLGYHSCIYFATQRAPAAPAALLHGATPLLIVIGSAFLPGERLRWWHLIGAALGFCGVLFLIDTGGTADAAAGATNAVLYLSLIGIAAGLWGLYSVITRGLPDVPTSSLGLFYATSAVIAAVAHLALEGWVAPAPGEWLAIAGLGILPMGLAIYCWDFGVKRGDIQALGAFSYSEPFIGAVLVAVVTHAVLRVDLLWSGALVVTGAVIASASLWQRHPAETTDPQGVAAKQPLTGAEIDFGATRLQLELLGNRILERLIALGTERQNLAVHETELRWLLAVLKLTMALWDEIGCEAAPAYFRRPVAPS
jgi:drug/metabolite transporter (DMT)-like permease